ncbi:10587_t:CDS:1, partial [Racocetra persica]
VFTEYLIDEDEFIHVIYDDETLENENHTVNDDTIHFKNNLPIQKK